VPPEVRFATKGQIALAQLERLLAAGAPRHCVLADAAYGTEAHFRLRLSELGLPYMVGIVSSLSVWPPGVEPLPAKRYSGRGRPPLAPRRSRRRQPLPVSGLAQSLPATAWQRVSWREGSNQQLSARFAAVRVRHAGGNMGRARLWPSQWLLIEWPDNEREPSKYWLSTLPEGTAINDLVSAAHMRWRIERDYLELKQELGLGHYEGRSWRGFHHHASLSIAAYGFLVAEQLTAGKRSGAKKNFIERQVPALPAGYIARGSPARTATRAQFHRNAASSAKRPAGRPRPSLSVLRSRKRKTALVTQ
jgi:SRSO17 transposase